MITLRRVVPSVTLMKLSLEARLASLLLQAVSAISNPTENGHLINNEFVKEVDEALQEHFSASVFLFDTEIDVDREQQGEA